MKKLTIAIAAAILWTSGAIAQQPQQPQAPSVYNLQVTPDELNLIADALQDQPYKKIFVLMAKLRQQVIEQQQPKPVAPTAPPAVTPEKPDGSQP